MEGYTQTNPSSILIQGAVESAVGDSILPLRRYEENIFARSRNSPLALRLTSLRGEFQQLLDGQIVRLDVVERVLTGSPAIDSPEGAESGLATEPAAVEVS